MTVPGVREWKSKRTSHSGSSILDVDPGDDIYFFICELGFWIRGLYREFRSNQKRQWLELDAAFFRGKDPSYKGKAYKPCKAGELNKTLEAFESMKKQGGVRDPNVWLAACPDKDICCVSVHNMSCIRYFLHPLV